MKTLLIAEDDSIILNFYTIVAHSLGYKIQEASDGQEAIKAIEDNHEGFDVILTDYQMPGYTGLDVIREAKRLNPRTKVILNSGDKVEEEARAAGADVFLSKPCTVHTLKEALEAAIS